ncbi:uncharacterized protein EV422DRAFT_179148 [Fimicolochytrium jonesii]|uniref:uncharacterized protein n=1 Tax=Fimicolochytrium jonesii TaxID=1396493 RepID=UPI0022FDD63C|nr:uncharacterized protein EV422DRAFT_179148 [Fimicolochytrium jonesii]KAI8818314.1 hypothetical protein EV422DRAFT_179148 [Fimicolochytrium jonesii]
MNPTPTYTHNLSLKWAEHGRPPLVGLLQQWRQSEASKTGHEGDGRVGTRSIFARVFVDGDGVSGDGEEVGKELPPTVLDTLLNLVSASTHYDSASKAYGIVHRSYAHIDKSPAQTLSNVPTTSALISFLSRWTYPTSSNIPPAADTDQITPHIAHQAISTAEFARDCVGILNMLSESELVEEQMISLVACFAHWLETFPEPHLLQIMPEIRKWLSIRTFAFPSLLSCRTCLLSRGLCADGRGLFHSTLCKTFRGPAQLAPANPSHRPVHPLLLLRRAPNPCHRDVDRYATV